MQLMKVLCCVMIPRISMHSVLVGRQYHILSHPTISILVVILGAKLVECPAILTVQADRYQVNVVSLLTEQWLVEALDEFCIQKVFTHAAVFKWLSIAITSSLRYGSS